MFLSTRNGIKLESSLKNQGVDGKFDIEVFTDASTSFGVGGYVEGRDDNWFRYEWGSGSESRPDIVFMELLGVCTAVQLWGKYWKGLDVKLNCDNMGVVEILKRKCCNFRRKDLMELVRVICQSAVDNKGLENEIADGSSRKNNIDASDEKYLNGDGCNCEDIIKNLSNCWHKNMPSKSDIIESNKDIGYFMNGWDNYKKERRRNKQLGLNYKY